MREIASRASSHCSRFVSRSTPKPPSSACELDSPVPSSTRPPETRSSVATRSATRAGWLNGGGICTMPWPRRMRLVRCDAAGEEDLGRARVRVLLEEVVLHLPHEVETEPVGQLDLLERVRE